MLIRGIIRGFAIDRKRILLARTPLRITYPTVAKKEVVIQIIERKSVGGGGNSAGTQKTVTATPRASSSSSPATTSSTSKKTTSSTTVSTGVTILSQAADGTIRYVYQPPLKTSSGGCSLNKY